MSKAYDLIRRVNAAARAGGVHDTVAQFDNVTTHAQYRVPYEKTMSVVQRGTRVLDWGTGNGHFSYMLDQLGAEITGYSYEPSPAAMRDSRAFTYVPGLPGDPRSLPFPDASFDVAISMGVLEHVWEFGGEDRASLAELARVLRPGGFLLTYHLPNRGGWVERMVKALGMNKHFHERKYDAPEIRSLWSAAGFTIVDMGVYNFLPRAELRALPRAIKDSRLFAAFYNVLDDALARIAPRLTTNFYVVARR